MEKINQNPNPQIRDTKMAPFLPQLHPRFLFLVRDGGFLFQFIPYKIEARLFGKSKWRPRTASKFTFYRETKDEHLSCSTGRYKFRDLLFEIV